MNLLAGTPIKSEFSAMAGVRFEGFAVLPSNAHVVEATMQMLSGMRSDLLITGPSGWGKSRFLDAVATLATEQSGSPVRPQLALNFHSHSAPSARMPWLILDQTEAVLAQPRFQQDMRAILELRTRLNKPTVIACTTTATSESLLAAVLPKRGWRALRLHEPQNEERQVILRLMAEREGLRLSDRLITLLSRKLQGNGNSFLGALQRLNLVQPIWQEPADELKAFGALRLYMADAYGWDLRDHVDAVVHEFYQAQPYPQNSNLADSLSLYFMQRSFGISEREVAAYYGLSLGQAYAEFNRVDDLIRSELAAWTQACLRTLANSLENA